MENLDFLKKILTTEHEYWIVAKRTSFNDCGRFKRGNDHILIITIPTSVRRGLKSEEILLDDVYKLFNSSIDQNIFLDNDYPPFQRSISWYDVYTGFPITKKIKEFTIEAMLLGSNDIYEYKKILDEKYS